jgi:hypothetical protein
MGASLLIVAARRAGSDRLALMSVVGSVVRSLIGSGVSRVVRRAVVVLGVMAVVVVGASAQVAPGVNSGLYGNLTLGVNGTAVTGVFSDARPGNGTEDAPQFSCSFLLRGTAGADGKGAIPVAVWRPSDGTQTNSAQTNGTLTVEQGTATLSLEGEPAGCAETVDRFVAKPYEEPAVKTGSWTAARMVSGAMVRLQEAPVSGGSGRGRVSKGDVVVVERRIGAWLQVETVFTPKPVRGWLRESDLFPSEP